MKKTKIVSTIGPSTDTEERMQSIANAGADVFRFNTKHSSPEWHKEKIETALKVKNEYGIDIGILVDLQGPEIRIKTKDEETIRLKRGDVVQASSSFHDDVQVVLPSLVLDVLSKGDEVLVDDGLNEFEVSSVRGKIYSLVANEDCEISHRKGVNLPGKEIKLPSLTKKDKELLEAIKDVNIDYVALSFCRTKKDIQILRKVLEKHGIEADIFAKIESQQALDNIDEIIQHADGIMVARGDLGVEIPFERIAYWQEVMVTKCRHASTPVIVATQMLDSMVKNPRPTRAEVTDVANAVFDGADALMLSAETATGDYPLRTIRAMRKIIVYNEKRTNGFMPELSRESETELVVNAAHDIIRENHGPEIDSIVIFTESGLTAKVFSRYRPHIPIVAVTNSERTARSLSVVYGVSARVLEFPEGLFVLNDEVLKKLVKDEVVEPGQKVLFIHGQHWMVEGQTNSLVILNV